jgi:hypothetical protein
MKQQPRVLKIDRTAAYTSYLCDLGGVYWLRDERVPGSQFFPDYRRRVTYLPSGALVVVDRITTPVPRTFKFRLLTNDPKISVADNRFNFTAGRSPLSAEIIDFSPSAWQRSTSVEKLPVWANPDRGVAVLTAPEQTNATFAVVIGVEGSAKAVKVKTSNEQVTIIDAGGQQISLSMKGN